MQYWMYKLGLIIKLALIINLALIHKNFGQFYNSSKWRYNDNYITNLYRFIEIYTDLSL